MVEDLPYGIFWVSDHLTSLFTCLPGGRHYQERQGKAAEVLSSHSKRGHNSGKRPPNISHLRNTPEPIHLPLTPSLSNWKPELPPGKGFLRTDLLGCWETPGESEAAIAHENCPGWGPDILFLFLTQTWHACSVEPSWNTDLTHAEKMHVPAHPWTWQKTVPGRTQGFSCFGKAA